MIYQVRRQSNNYVATSTTYNDALALRAQLRKNQAMLAPDSKFAIRIRPRLGKNNPAAHMYSRRWVPTAVHRLSKQDIKPEHGTRFDVYEYFLR